jgi:hypothetical protein
MEILLERNHGVFFMPYLVPGLMGMLLEIRPWCLLYVLKGSWSYGNIARDKTMASLHALLGPWSYGNITRDTTMVFFVRLKKFLV